MKIPFNVPFTCAQSFENVKCLVDQPQQLNELVFSRLCVDFFENNYPGYRAHMTCSCTRAMDAIALCIGFEPGDEVIMPSFNYVGIVNSFMNTKAKIVFADIDPQTMNISIASILDNISQRTKAIVVMHYGGVGTEMTELIELCKERNIVLIEDNAQGIQSKWGDKLLGSFGDFSCISFDRLKNVSCSEGGVVLYQEKYHEKMRLILDIGTNKSDFESGKVDQYEWVTHGSKFDLSEYNAAVLHPLLLLSNDIIQKRLDIWNTLYDELLKLDQMKSYLPQRMKSSQHNAHIFFLKCNSLEDRNNLMGFLRDRLISCAFHYSPLHSSTMAKKIGASMILDEHTTKESSRLVRIPIHNGLNDHQINYLVETLRLWEATK